MQDNTKKAIEKIELEKALVDLFAHLQIQEDYPGTIIRDIDSILHYLHTNDIEMDNSQKAIAGHRLDAINQLFVNPVSLVQKRSVQKSYHNINGVFLLLRCSGLVEARRSHDVSFLKVKETIYESWQSLTPTEKYLTLIRVWMLNTHPEVIGEKGNNFRISQFVLTFILEKLTNEFDDFGGEINNSIASIPETYNFKLCELFGLIEIKYADNGNYTAVRRTEVGKAIMSLILRVQLSDSWYTYVYKAKPQKVINRWQQYFKTYFPTWENNLLFEKQHYREGLFVFKVQTDQAWRRLVISSREKMSVLCNLILTAFNFDHDHLYTVEIKNRFGIPITYNHPYMDEIPKTDDLRVGDVDVPIGDMFEFIYDFGNSWEFTIILEDIRELTDNSPLTLIEETEGESPQQYQAT